jgi:hypothetical protein
VGPAWRAALRWRGRQLRAALSYDRAPHASAVLGSVFVADRATLRTLGRFGRDERFVFRGRARLQRLVAPSEPAERRGPILRWQAQAALAARPWPRKHVEIALSYRLTHQDGGLLGRRRVRTLERNLLMLSLTVGWPLAGQD